MRVATLVLMLGILLAAGPTWAGTVAKHSGEVVSEDLARHTITLEEMGPWHGPGTKPIRHVVHLTDGTKVELVTRAADGHAPWPGGFTERPLRISGLRTGDYVTVAAEKAGKQMVAASVEVVRPTSTASSR